MLAGGLAAYLITPAAQALRLFLRGKNHARQRKISIVARTCDLWSASWYAAFWRLRQQGVMSRLR
jgi:hypothetical protein